MCYILYRGNYDSNPGICRPFCPSADTDGLTIHCLEVEGIKKNCTMIPIVSAEFIVS